MSYAPRPTALPSHLRSNSTLGGSTQSSALQARINEKKTELENLKQLRDLSGGLADQMQQLEEKLATLSGGTEAVAAVLSNWHSVLRAIHMASAKIPKPKEEDGVAEKDGPDLPQTLVRIPVEQAQTAQALKAAEQAAEAGE